MCSGRAEHGHGEDDRGHPREAGPLRQQRRGSPADAEGPTTGQPVVGKVKGEGELRSGWKVQMIRYVSFHIYLFLFLYIYILYIYIVYIYIVYIYIYCIYIYGVAAQILRSM